MWEEFCDTTSAMFVIACMATWPVTQHRLGQWTSLRWTLAETGNGVAGYIAKAIVGILLADLWNYWKHRLLHWRLFYAFHKVSHRGFHETV